MPNLKDVLPTIKDLKPSEDCILWRYTDIPSMIEILSFEYLPLIRVSRLSDPTEGALLNSVLNKLPKAADFGKKFVYDLYKNATFASCWCAHKDELAPMWERFSPRDGVAIKTNAKRLLNCLAPGHGCDIKWVKYINKDSPDDILSQLASIDPDEYEKLQRDLYFYKMSDFLDEREVRILKCRAPKNAWGLVAADGTNRHNLEQLKDNYITASEDIWRVGIATMQSFIDEIIISPTARPGIFKIVNDLLETNNEKRALMGKPELEIKLDDSRRQMWF